MRPNPEMLLKVPALVTSDQHARGGHKRDDLYIFLLRAKILHYAQACQTMERFQYLQGMVCDLPDRYKQENFILGEIK